MTTRAVFLTLLLAVPAAAAAQHISAGDSTAILAAVERWERGWATKEAALASQDYAADADWTNAFGMRRIGRPAIHELLTEVFTLPFVMAGDTEYEYHDLQVLSPQVVLLRSRAIRTGQQLPDGTVEEPRRTNHLRVFAKRDGGWRIVSHLIGDERTPGEPR
ncbi:MAG: SgcJ/EcaC family oxidoreductase [Gemmatimonadales bacterium]